VDVVILNIADLYGAMGHLSVYGTKGVLAAQFADFFHAFKAQLIEFVQYLRTGRHPFDFAQTVELMKLVIAGILSREQGGRRVALSDIGC
jgi:predicted dehydrogenase